MDDRLFPLLWRENVRFALGAAFCLFALPVGGLFQDWVPVCGRSQGWVLAPWIDVHLLLSHWRMLPASNKLTFEASCKDEKIFFKEMMMIYMYVVKLFVQKRSFCLQLVEILLRLDKYWIYIA
ncbi:gamma-aminobutyraldehyde dehydrogenase [Striga asiatica]|uniref:Gamma-aminobutyraldehyde dehydrogenase n=1 Tax=Striga asiatica TaxID=4170 RepID=A0A5A7PD49_STRAF|nr:gamma-aminobutyraldehyde dehydrogenase [Striga asiatica]